MPLAELVRRRAAPLGALPALVLALAGAPPARADGWPSSQVPPTVQTRPRIPNDSEAIRRERLRYIALALRYCDGEVDLVLQDLSAWNWRSFSDVRGHMRRFGEWQLREVQCAAMMHTEMALRAAPRTTSEASHLNWARELLRLLDRQPLDQSFRHDWCVAVIAHLHGQLRFVEVDDYLRDATRAFPDDAAVLFAWGLLREAQTSRRLAAVVASLPGRTEISLGRFPERGRAQREAEQYYRRALDRDATMLEAGVRLGRVLDGLDRPDAALQMLARVRAQSGDPRLVYLAWLFSGQILHRRGRLPEAIEAFRSAAALYPQCQAATVAQSYAIREAGNHEEAVRLVRLALSHGTSEECLDPWWLYDFGNGPQADALFDALRQKVRR